MVAAGVMQDLGQHFHLLRGALCIVDRHGRILRANPAFGELLATDPDAMRGTLLGDYAMSEDRATLEDSCREPAASRDIEWRSQLRDGRVRHLQQATTHVGSGCLLQVTDVTQARHVELALRRQAALYESLVVGLDGLGDGVAVADDESVLFVNTALTDMLGYEQTDLVGRSWPVELVPREMRSWWQRLWRGEVDDLLAERSSLTLRARDGRDVHVELSMQQVRPDSPLRLLVVRNVTERNARFADQLQLAAIVEASADAIGSLDEYGSIQRWNRGAERMFGRSDAEIVGTPFVELISESSRLTVEGAMHRVLEGESLTREAVEGIRDDSEPLDLSIAFSPLRDAARNVIGVAVVARDITEQRRLERELTRFTEDLQAANRDLEHASQVRSEFVSMASHELRTPLTTIRGFARTMIDLWPRISDADKQSYLELIDSQAQRLSRLVDNLLTASRFESGRIATHPRLVQVREPLEHVIMQLSLGHVDLRCDPDLQVTCDPDHLEQIVENLLANARKYAEPPFVIDASSTAGELRVCVSDSGPGVPDEFVPHLFERFTRAPESDAGDVEGAGLGLAIVSRLCEESGGRAWYEPNEPTGARFCVTIRDATSDPEAQRA